MLELRSKRIQKMLILALESNNESSQNCTFFIFYPTMCSIWKSSMPHTKIILKNPQRWVTFSAVTDVIYRSMLLVLVTYKKLQNICLWHLTYKSTFCLRDCWKSMRSSAKILWSTRLSLIWLTRGNTKGRIVYFIEGRSPTRHKWRFCL